MKKIIYLIFSLFTVGCAATSKYPITKFSTTLNQNMATAIKKGNIQKIEQLAKKVNLNEVHYDGMTFLFYAMHTKQKESISTLIKLGANPMQYDRTFGSPLIAAVRSNTAETLKVMLDAGASPDSLDDEGTSLVCYAAQISSMETLKLLVARGADLDLVDPELKYTALYEAMCSRLYGNAIFLINSGARVDIVTKFGATIGYCVQEDLIEVHPKDETYKQLLIIKQLITERGVKFPAKPPYCLRN